MHPVVLKALQEGMIAVATTAVNAVLADPTFDHVIDEKTASRNMCGCDNCSK